MCSSPSTASPWQGQRSLNHCSGKDFQQEVLVPAATAPLHGQAVATGMLLQQREREAIEPRKVLTEVLVPNARFILAIRHVQAPVAGVLNAPVTADRMGETLHTDRQTADVIANLDRLFPIADTLRL